MKKSAMIIALVGLSAVLISAYYLTEEDVTQTQEHDISSDMTESIGDIFESSAVQEASVTQESSVLESSTQDSSHLGESRSTDEISSVETSSALDSTNADSSDSSSAFSQSDDSSSQAEKEEEKGILSSSKDIELHDIDGGNTSFEFTYDKTVFEAFYTYDNWKIVDSYRITNTADMEIICQALIEVNPIHGKDMVSYRTAEDMAYEWDQHNLAYEILSEDSPWRENAKDVDLNPDDQGKSILDFYLDRTGKKSLFE